MNYVPGSLMGFRSGLVFGVCTTREAKWKRMNAYEKWFGLFWLCNFTCKSPSEVTIKTKVTSSIGYETWYSKNEPTGYYFGNVAMIMKGCQPIVINCKIAYLKP